MAIRRWQLTNGVRLAWHLVGEADIVEANSAVGIWGDFVVWYPELSTASPNRWGDYVTVRRSNPDPDLFGGFAYATLLDTTTANPTDFFFDPFYIQFGRRSVIKPEPRPVG